MLKRYNLVKSHTRRFGEQKAISTILIAAIVGVIALAAVGGYFYSTSSMSTSHVTNLSSTTTVASTIVSKTEIAPVMVSIVSGAHLQSQSQHFVPQTIIVEIGVNNTITWVNQDVAPHTVTSDTNSFNSGTIEPGANFTMTFTSPGTYHYHCNIHPFMTGTLIVLNANGQTISSTSSSTSSNPVTSSSTHTSTSSSCAYYYGGRCY